MESTCREPKEDRSVRYFQLKRVNQSAELKQYFLKSYSIYEKLFSCIKQNASFYARPQPLRHPLIFYYGHTAVFYVNKLIQAELLAKRINPVYERIFAVGVNEMGWDDLNEKHYDWPTVQQTKHYRDQVKSKVLQAIDNYSGLLGWEEKGWAILMGVEHELMHLETSAAILRRLPIGEIQPIEGWTNFPHSSDKSPVFPENKLVRVTESRSHYNVTADNLNKFCWDNEIGQREIDIKAFEVSQYLVSNGELLEFIKAKGYESQQFWTEEGWKWKSDTKAQQPLFWVGGEGDYKLRTLCQEIDMPWDWPAVVNNLEARAFCSWKSKQLGKEVRLPTEDEFDSLVKLMGQKDVLKSNHSLHYGCSESAVNTFNSFGELYDIVGNVWQHLCTPIYPFEGFKIHPYYEDFTSPTFDGVHDGLKGGSWITHGSYVHPQSRNFFRRHFYQFAGFRYVHSQNPIKKEISLEFDDEGIQFYLSVHYFTQDGYIQKMFDLIKKDMGSQLTNNTFGKALVVGCSVGKLCFELSKLFKEVIGLDSTSRFFRIATLLQQKGEYKINTHQAEKDKTITTKDFGMEKPTNINFFQQKPDNIDIKKFNNFDLIVVDNFSLPEDLLLGSLAKIHSYLNRNGVLVVSSISSAKPYKPVNSTLIEETLKEKLTGIGKSVDISFNIGQKKEVQSTLSVWRLHSQ